MIYLIDQAIRSKITALNFVERYGGFAMPVTADFPSDEGANRKTFPVSCSLSASECFEQDKYKNLVPNDAYKSVCYIEEVAINAFEFGGSKRKSWTTTARIRVVCWLNYNKLGLDDCKSTDRFALALIAAVMENNGYYSFDIDSIKGAVHIQGAKIVEKNPNVVFGRYSYANMSHLFFWPFDFFAVDFSCGIHISGGCVPGLTLGSEVTCLTNW